MLLRSSSPQPSHGRVSKKYENWKEETKKQHIYTHRLLTQTFQGHFISVFDVLASRGWERSSRRADGTQNNTWLLSTRASQEQLAGVELPVIDSLTEQTQLTIHQGFPFCQSTLALQTYIRRTSYHDNWNGVHVRVSVGVWELVCGSWKMSLCPLKWLFPFLLCVIVSALLSNLECCLEILRGDSTSHRCLCSYPTDFI